jgi:hypothetical protein
VAKLEREKNRTRMAIKAEVYLHYTTSQPVKYLALYYIINSRITFDYDHHPGGWRACVQIESTVILSLFIVASCAINPIIRDKQSKFPDFINISIKKSWPRSKTLIQVRTATSSKPIPEVRKMI